MTKLILFIALIAPLQHANTVTHTQTQVETSISDAQAGYDQAAYDECMDQDGTTAQDCEAI